VGRGRHGNIKVRKVKSAGDGMEIGHMVVEDRQAAASVNNNVAVRRMLGDDGG
jgi:hypothetical protein